MSETTEDPFSMFGGNAAFTQYLMDRSRSPEDMPDPAARALMACLTIPQPIQKWMVESGAAEPLIASIAETITAAEKAKDAEIASLRAQLDEAKAETIRFAGALGDHIIKAKSEARRKAIEECAAIAEQDRDFCDYDTASEIAKSIRALLSESKT